MKSYLMREKGNRCFEGTRQNTHTEKIPENFLEVEDGFCVGAILPLWKKACYHDGVWVWEREKLVECKERYWTQVIRRYTFEYIQDDAILFCVRIGWNEFLGDTQEKL